MSNRAIAVVARVVLFFLGVWLILGPFYFRFGTVQSHANEVLIGFFTMVFSMYRIGHSLERSAWVNYLNAVMGAWLVASPFIYGYSGLAGPTTNEIVVGAAMIVLAAISFLLGQRDRAGAHP